MLGLGPGSGFSVLDFIEPRSGFAPEVGLAPLVPVLLVLFLVLVELLVVLVGLFLVLVGLLLVLVGLLVELLVVLVGLLLARAPGPLRPGLVLFVLGRGSPAPVVVCVWVRV